MKALKHLTFLLLLMTQLQAADVDSLIEFYKQNYRNFYRHRLCGQNIELLLKEAQEDGIDLEGAYVLKIEGSGFLETSGFYSRHGINERTMLGYFHVVLVADNIVFDFDLAGKLTPKLPSYVRLQFTPPYEPFIIFGIKYRALEQLPWWTVTRYEWRDYLLRGNPSWKKKLSEILDLQAVMTLPR